MAKTVRKLPDITFRHVDSEYAAPFFDVPKEQNLLLTHDVIVLQHPLMWYSSPPFLKAWYDQVLSHGRAYPADKSQLAGKTLQLAVTTDGKADVYRSGGAYGFTMSEVLRPKQMTAACCGMNFAPVFAVHGMILPQWGGVSDEFLHEQVDIYAAIVKQFANAVSA